MRASICIVKYVVGPFAGKEIAIGKYRNSRNEEATGVIVKYGSVPDDITHDDYTNFSETVTEVVKYKLEFLETIRPGHCEDMYSYTVAEEAAKNGASDFVPKNKVLTPWARVGDVCNEMQEVVKRKLEAKNAKRERVQQGLPDASPEDIEVVVSAGRQAIVASVDPAKRSSRESSGNVTPARRSSGRISAAAAPEVDGQELRADRASSAVRADSVAPSPRGSRPSALSLGSTSLASVATGSAIDKRLQFAGFTGFTLPVSTAANSPPRSERSARSSKVALSVHPVGLGSEFGGDTPAKQALVDINNLEAAVDKVFDENWQPGRTLKPATLSQLACIVDSCGHNVFV
jgi:hypothetical protein